MMTFSFEAVCEPTPSAKLKIRTQDKARSETEAKPLIATADPGDRTMPVITVKLATDRTSLAD
jgi:hypothetical protein